MQHKYTASAAAIIVVAILSVGIWSLSGGFHSKPPVPEQASRQEVLKFLASEEFGQLKKDEQRQYLSALRKTREQAPGPGDKREERQSVFRELNDKQRERLRSNMREVHGTMMKERLDKYYALPAEQRTAYLDNIIDRMQQHMQRRRAPDNQPGATRTNGNEPRRRDSDSGKRPDWKSRIQAHIKNHIETSDPETRARMTQFRLELRKRMEERGIEPLRMASR